MSKRVAFTNALSLLILHIDANKDRPLVDFVKRSTEEQKRMFEAGLSKCDGELVVSKHQVGLAADIYLISADGKLIDWATVPEKATEYHEYWEILGGRPAIKWDLGHFEF